MAEAAAKGPNSGPGGLFELPALDYGIKPKESSTPYDPVGALGGLFAPAYNRADPLSVEAVTRWTQERTMSPEQLEATRMAAEFRDPEEGVLFPGSPGLQATYGGIYGEHRIPTNTAHGLEKGILDPQALKAMAQGLKYDPATRNQAIAARLASNEMAKAAFAKTKAGRAWWEGGPMFDPYQQRQGEYLQD